MDRGVQNESLRTAKNESAQTGLDRSLDFGRFRSSGAMEHIRPPSNSPDYGASRSLNNYLSRGYRRMASYTLNDHVRNSTAMTDSDDSKSNTSTVSSARVAESCPCCQKEIQARFLFNHLRKLHPEYVKSMYGVWKDDQMDELIKYNAPFPIEWVEKDDFDDDVTKTLWGCLGCNNTYTTQNNAAKHCLGKCKKDHNAQLRRIKKEEQQDKAKREEKVSAERKRWINRTAQQVFLCVQQDLAYFDKKWTEVGAKVSRYLCALKHDSPQDYIFFPATHPTYEDDKKKMEALEMKIDKEMTAWKRKYEDILPLLWGATDLISHTAYEELEKMITIGYPEYKF